MVCSEFCTSWLNMWKVIIAMAFFIMTIICAMFFTEKYPRTSVMIIAGVVVGITILCIVGLV